MNKLNLSDVKVYVNKNIGVFHENRLIKLKKLKLKKVLKSKNPYLFRAKNIYTSEGLIKPILDAYLSSQEETIFGEFLEGLARFICGNVFDGKKSAAEGIDLEFVRENKRYLISIKSGPNWGNSSQISKMKSNFIKASKIIGNPGSDTQNVFVNGCCYGRNRIQNKGNYLKICGQDFWELISGNENLYTEIVEPLGHNAREKNDEFQKEYARVINTFTQEFSKDFCVDGNIDWTKLVEFNSKSAVKK